MIKGILLLLALLQNPASASGLDVSAPPAGATLGVGVTTGAFTTCLRVPADGSDVIAGPCVGGFTGLNDSTPEYDLDVTGDLRVTDQIIAQGSATVQGNAFSVGGTSLSVSGGLTGLGVAPSNYVLSLYGSQGLGCRGDQGAHGITNYATTDAYCALNRHSASLGGLNILGISNSAAQSGLIIDGMSGGATAAVAAIRERCSKKSGVGIATMASTDVCYRLEDNNSSLGLIQVYGTGETVFRPNTVESSTITAKGYWRPRQVGNAAAICATTGEAGAVIMDTAYDLWTGTGTTVGGWRNSRTGAGPC